jgi:putative oligomerization/nucleic acid binding protein
MPGLIRGVARTAVVAGTATAVSNRVSRRQARRWGAQEDPYDQPPQQYEQAPPPAAPAAPAVDPIEQLKQLADLHQQGVLTDEEFAVQKAKILGS